MWFLFFSKADMADVTKSLSTLVQCQQRIVRLLWGQVTPKPFTVCAMSEDPMSFINFQLKLATPTADTRTQRVTVTAAGFKPMSADLPADVKEYEFSIPQDTKFVVGLQYIDDVGNVSDTVTAEFTAVDTFAPVAPSSVGELKAATETEDAASPTLVPEPASGPTGTDGPVGPTGEAGETGPDAPADMTE